MGEYCVNLFHKKILTLFLFISFISYGQFYHGLDVGVNMNNATFNVEQSSDPKSVIGFSIGYVAERELNDKVFVRIGFNYNRRSIDATNRSGTNTSKESWSSDIIEIPINLGYYLNYNRRNRQIFIDAGFNAGYNNRAILKNEVETVYLDIGSDAEIKRMTFGANIGLGLLIKKRVKFRLNYYHGLTNITNIESANWKNKTIGISINYFLREKEVY